MELGGLWWSNFLNSALPPQRHRPDTWPECQDPGSPSLQLLLKSITSILRWFVVYSRSLQMQGTSKWLWRFNLLLLRLLGEISLSLLFSSTLFSIIATREHSYLTHDIRGFQNYALNMLCAVSYFLYIFISLRKITLGLLRLWGFVFSPISFSIFQLEAFLKCLVILAFLLMFMLKHQ